MHSHKQLRILAAARDAWLAAADFRVRRERYKRYAYGDQWSDPVVDDKGNVMTEREYLQLSDCRPLTNNMIRQIIKVVVGRYRTACADSGVYNPDSDANRFVLDNDLAELDCRMLEEFLISGCAIQRVSRDARSYGTDLWIDNVDPRLFFVNPHKDPRGRDIELIGMLHDLSLAEIIARFAPNDSRMAATLASIYSRKTIDTELADVSSLGRATTGADDFFCAPHGRCRIIEVWTLDCRTRRVGRGRRSVEFVWHCRWFAPDGTLVSSYDSPYAHRSHPFVLKLYPLTDGEVHSFVEDVIDQQRCINRLIVSADHMLEVSAKGVLLFPESQRPPTTSWAEIQSAWSKSSAVIPITGQGAIRPEQVVTNTADSGTYQLLALQMKLFDNISGVGDVIAGRSVPASTGASLYEGQLRNSAIALADLLESFISFRTSRNLKATTT